MDNPIIEKWGKYVNCEGCIREHNKGVVKSICLSCKRLSNRPDNYEPMEIEDSYENVKYYENVSLEFR